MERFNGSRLRVLRRFHNLTQRGLAELIGSPASAVNAYERGVRVPKGTALDALCAELRVQQDFFFELKNDDEFQEHETNFRSLASTPERLRRKVLAHATLFGTLLEYLRASVRLPTLNLPALQATNTNELELAAERCRVEWGVGVDAPIQNVTHMIESAGVVVTMLDGEIGKQIDAFSRYGPTNLIVLNPSKGSATRARMDIAHEAAHAALHRGGLPDQLGVREDQANYFASALLLPRTAFAREFWALGYARTWDHLLALKERWGASVPAIVVRSFHLGLINAAEYRRRYKSMAKAGWLRGAEPGEPVAETPQLFLLALSRFQSATGKNAAVIAQDLKWTPELFKQITGVAAARPEAPNVSSFEEFRQRKLAASEETAGVTQDRQ